MNIKENQQACREFLFPVEGIDGKEAATVRVVGTAEAPMFVADDVCTVLGMTTENTRNLDEDERGLTLIQTLGGRQKMTCITESGLYHLIFKSRKPAGGASPRRPLLGVKAEKLKAERLKETRNSERGIRNEDPPRSEFRVPTSLEVLKRRELREWERVCALKEAPGDELNPVREAWYRRAWRVVRMKQQDFADCGTRVLVIILGENAENLKAETLKSEKEQSGALSAFQRFSVSAFEEGGAA